MLVLSSVKHYKDNLTVVCWLCSDYRVYSIVPPFFSFAACGKYAVLFRKYVSRKGIGKGRAILEWVGLSPEVINQCYGTPGLDEEEVIQKGLHKWRETCGDCTWQVLLNAMQFAGIAQNHCTELEEELNKMMQGEVTFPLKYSKYTMPVVTCPTSSSV